VASATIFDSLKADHDRQRTMLSIIAEASADDRAALFEEFRIDISAHAAAEEQTLYATMMADPELQDDARHSVSEHKEIDDMIVSIAKAEPGSGDWDEAFDELRTEYDHHITEEEEEMFPAAADAMSDDDAARLATVFSERKPNEIEKAEAIDPAEKEERD
jgi:iron-sulfur cluster repair protein YtfE (RIC family)